MTRARWIYADALRIAAIVGVVLIHITAPVVGIRGEPGDGSYWWTAHLINAASRWSVPVLVMIGGLLLLAPDRRESALIFYRRRLGRIAPLFLLWSLIYYAWDIRKEPGSFDWGRFALGLAKGTLHYHLWFVYLIVILCILTPPLRVLVRRVPTSVLFCIAAAGLVFSGLASIADWHSRHFFINACSIPGYIGYYLLGCVLSIVALNKGTRRILYVGGLLSYAAVAGGTNWLLAAHPSAKPIVYDYTSLPVALMAAAIFIGAKRIGFRTATAATGKPQLPARLSASVFHIYLSHVLIMEWLYRHRPWDILHSSPLIYAPIVAAVVLAGALLLDLAWRALLHVWRAGCQLAVRFREERDSVHPLKEIYLYREMLRNMVMKDLRTRYKGSALGFLWTFLNPLLMLGIYTAVFSFIMKADIPHFPLFILVALLPWNFFAQSITGGARSIINHAELLKKVYFPRAVIPLSVIGSNAINYLLTLLILIPALGLSGIPLTWALSAFPIVLLAQTLLVLPVALLAAVATVYLRDLEHILNVLVIVFFYLTPIVFPLSLIPHSYRWMFDYNPMTPIIGAYRDVFLYGDWPNFGLLLPMLLVLLVVNAAALAAFTLLQKHVVEEV